MIMNIIFSKLLYNLKPISKNISYKNFRHNVFVLSSVCNTRIQYQSTKPIKSTNENDGVYSQLGKNTDLPTSRKQKHGSLIELNGYYNPVFSDTENFDEKFWTAYEKKLKAEGMSNQYNDYPDRIRYKKVYDHPYHRAFGIVRDDIVEFFGRLKRNPLLYIRNPTLETRSPHENQIFPHYCDIVIIGGGIVGTSTAFHLQERGRKGLRIVVVEKDMSYSKASTVLSVGGIRQQFSTPENILLSKYGMDFLQQADTRLALNGQPPPNVDLCFSGYLTLADEEGFEKLNTNYEMQRAHGSFVEMYSKDQLKSKFPWMNMDGVEAGVYGVQREGWFDPWSLLLAVNRKTKELGTVYVNGTVTDCSYRLCTDVISTEDHSTTAMRQINKIEITLPTGEKRDINCAVCVIAAGAWSGDVGKILGIGTAASGLNSIPIPVEPRKRFVYCVKSPDGPSLNCPLLIDPSGSYFRREGLADLYICGRSPCPGEEPSIEDLSVDHEFFENKVWPEIAHRCPSFEKLKVHSSWAGYYDYNTFDQNAIIGKHPLYMNLFIGTGFSGHGIQQAAGAGCAISELILDSELKTLPIENLGFERIVTFNPLVEKCCY